MLSQETLVAARIVNGARAAMINIVRCDEKTARLALEHLKSVDPRIALFFERLRDEERPQVRAGRRKFLLEKTP